MGAQPLQLYARLTSTQGLETEAKALQAQMKNLNPNSPEYIYDELQLQREEMVLQLQKEHPDLNPQTLAGDQALGRLLAQNPAYQSIQEQITALIDAYPSECTTWGIPMSSDVVTFPV